MNYSERAHTVGGFGTGWHDSREIHGPCCGLGGRDCAIVREFDSGPDSGPCWTHTEDATGETRAGERDSRCVVPVPPGGPLAVSASSCHGLRSRRRGEKAIVNSGKTKFVWRATMSPLVVMRSPIRDLLPAQCQSRRELYHNLQPYEPQRLPWVVV